MFKSKVYPSDGQSSYLQHYYKFKFMKGGGDACFKTQQ